MQQKEQIRLIKGLMTHLDDGTNVDTGRQVRNPVESYINETIAGEEWQSFFMDYPHVVGLSGDLPENGSFLTNQDLGKPILCTRDQFGHFHAFLNVCRHRGTTVETEVRGRKNQFSCPFHAWTYDHQGSLVAVPKEDHFGPVDKSCHGLIPLPAEEKHGLLWVQPNPNGELDLDNQLGKLGAELESWNIGQYVFNGDTRYDHGMNWKLANDTFGETYHFNVLHKNTLAETLYGNVQMYDTFERNHRMILCLKNVDQLRAEPETNWHIQKAGIPIYYLFPNVQLIMGGTGPTLVRIYPDGSNPHLSHSQISFYLDPKVKAMENSPEFEEMYRGIEARMTGFAEVIQKEDYVVAASSHAGARSVGAPDYFIFGRNEPALHHYHNTYREALGKPPLESFSK